MWVTTGRHQTHSPSTVFPHIPLVKSRKTAILSDVDSHWVRILLSFLPTFLDVAGPNILKLSYTNNTFLSPCNFCIRWNYFNHPENGGCMFLPYTETCNHCAAQKHKRRPLPGQQPSWKPNNNWWSKSERQMQNHEESVHNRCGNTHMTAPPPSSVHPPPFLAALLPL